MNGIKRDKREATESESKISFLKKVL